MYLKDYEQSPIAVEGLDYEWIDENRLVYVTVDKFNNIFQYDLLACERQFIHYGSGVCLYDEDEKSYVLMNISEIPPHGFFIMNFQL